MAKAQGLPLSFIVIAAISALVLVLIVLFTVGGFGKTGSQIWGAMKTDLETAQTNCQTICDGLAMTGTSQWESSSYCVKTFALDIDADGKVGGCDNKGKTALSGKYGCASKTPPQEIGLNCWDSPINKPCTKTFTASDGSTYSCTNPIDVGTTQGACKSTDCVKV